MSPIASYNGIRTALLAAALLLTALWVALPVRAQQNGVSAGRPGGDQSPEVKAAAANTPVSAASSRVTRRRTRTTLQPQSADTPATQRAKDQRLLQLQQADSSLQQQLQDNQLKALNRTRQAQQNEPRIQSAPAAPPASPLPSTSPADRIQDAPSAQPAPPQPVAPAPVQTAPQH